MQKQKLKLVLLLVFLNAALGLYAQDIHQSLGARWEVVSTGDEKSVSKLILLNRSAKQIPCDGWSLWFNFIKVINTESGRSDFKIEHQNGDLYHVSFAGRKQTIPVGDSLEISFTNEGRLSNFTDSPSGLYLVYDICPHEGYSLGNVFVARMASSEDKALERLNAQYRLNELAANSSPQLIIPSPSSVRKNGGSYVITDGATLYADGIFVKEAQELINFFKIAADVMLRPAKEDGKQARIRMKQLPGLGAEEYQMTISERGIEILAGDPRGVFYAIQSLKSLSRSADWSKRKRMTFPGLKITDKPRFRYRGLMVDVARNFHQKESILRILDIMAMYKLNALHLHLNDDEGWRIEIPSLPELTEVGSVRSPLYATGKSLQPSYGSGAGGENNAFYTVNQFVEIIQYAKARHIMVIPELETPGHARAAIKAMQARYEKLMAQGDRKRAEMYLLNDFDDKSVYSSAQNWTDNVMNAALPSTYAFIETVIDDLKSIYDKAGLPLRKIHLGGDEVPKGAWEKSPAIRQMMDSLKLSSVYEVWPWYIAKIAGICRSKGLELSGWEEMGMENKGRDMQVNPLLAQDSIQLDVWNNLPDGGQEDLAYRLANAGYKVVFTSANNFYFDLAWADHFDEPGHTWAGFTSIKKSYSFLPSNYFLNISTSSDGDSLSSGYFSKKERLTQAGKGNLIGIKGTVWSEKISDKDRLEYMLFPRLIALAERAWAPAPFWELKEPFHAEAFLNNYTAFMHKLGDDELKKIDVINGGYSYRLPAIGISISSGHLSCNAEYPGFEVYYTQDGSEPSLGSGKYTSPIDVKQGRTYRFKVIARNGRSGKTVSVKL